MFQFLRRVSGSLLPRPDRPWRDDATSHAPTIGRKRRYSITDGIDLPSSAAKRAKTDLETPDTTSEGGSAEGDVLPSVGQQAMKEVDLEDKGRTEDPLSIRPEGIPLPDSPSGSPEPESDSPANSDAPEETSGEERADSTASPSPEDSAEAEPVTTDTDTPGGTALTVGSRVHDTPETLEVSE